MARTGAIRKLLTLGTGWVLTTTFFLVNSAGQIFIKSLSRLPFSITLFFTMHAQIYTSFTTKLDRPDEPVAPHLAMDETFQLGPNNIPYTQLGRYRCANTPAKTLEDNGPNSSVNGTKVLL